VRVGVAECSGVAVGVAVGVGVAVAVGVCVLVFVGVDVGEGVRVGVGVTGGVSPLMVTLPFSALSSTELSSKMISVLYGIVVPKISGVLPPPGPVPHRALK
jgi:hypothetical protein